MKYRLLILFLFIIQINTDLIYGYSWRDDNTYNYNSYNYYNDYKIFSNLNFKPTYESNFYFNTRDMFNQNKLYETVRQTWQLNSYENNTTYSENIAKYVAPSIVLSDYVGNNVKENTTWESFNYQTNQYKPQTYSNVILSEETSLGAKNLISFQMLIAEQDWKTRNIVDNITYNEQNLVQSMRITTSDIDDNKYTQTMSNIKYKENPQLKSYNDLMNECDRNMTKRDYYLWKDLRKNLEQYDRPAEKVVSSFDLEVIDPDNNRTNIRYENIEWDKKAITSFEYQVMPDDPLSSVIPDSPVIPAKVFNPDLCIGAGIYDKDKTIDTTIFADVFKGQNPLELAGCSSIQIADAKLPVITKNYNDDGLFSIPLVEVKTTCRQGVDVSSSLSSISQQLQITDKPTEQNRLKTQIFELSQTDIQSTKNVIWNNDLSNAKTEDLKSAVKAIETSIMQKLDNFNKTSPDGLKLKLENNRITTESKITNEQGEEIKNANFVISSIPLVEGKSRYFSGQGVDVDKKLVDNRQSDYPPNTSFVIPAKAGIDIVLEHDKPKVFTKPEIKKEPNIFNKITTKIKHFVNKIASSVAGESRFTQGVATIVAVFAGVPAMLGVLAGGAVIKHFKEQKTEMVYPQNNSKIEPKKYGAFGILTGKAEAQKVANNTGMAVRVNPSRGILGDLVESGLERIGKTKSDMSRQVEKDLRIGIQKANILLSKEENKQEFIFHSQGTILGVSAMESMLKDGIKVGSNVKFVFMGPAVDKSEVEELVEKLGISKKQFDKQLVFDANPKDPVSNLLSDGRTGSIWKFWTWDWTFKQHKLESYPYYQNLIKEYQKEKEERYYGRAV